MRLLFLLMLTAVLTGNCAENATNAVPAAADAAAVVAEQWSTNFPAVLAKARAEHRPLIITGGTTSCGGCVRMAKNLDDLAFQRWVKGTGIYLARVYMNLADKHPPHAAGRDFLLKLPSEEKLSIPHVGIYWPRAEGEPVTAHFRYHRGAMPGKRNPVLMGEFVSAAESVLAEYFAGQKRPTWDEIVQQSKKKIAGAVEGKGKVVIVPSSGELTCGKEVRIVAVPEAGYRVAGWKGPDGKLLKDKKSKSLSVQYTSSEGTYTAVFEKR